MKPSTNERAILVGVELKGNSSRRAQAATGPEVDVQDSIAELATLAESAGAEVVDTLVQSRDAVEGATQIGSGKVKELTADIEARGIDVAIFDRDLTPTQLRNLERELGCKVIDRTQLILDIFASRARTREGQLQVELAQLNYLLPRLAGRGTQMSRLGGGIGTRGPGETQLETDRRRIFRRIKKIEEDLESVRSGRTVQRRQRQAVPLATVSLVGYTNAGKSTLFNRLTSAGVLADARMFATLDPTVRQFRLPSNRRALLSDTVGFIANLPTTLVKAFRATLEEVVEAALLLHVVDVSSEHAEQHSTHVTRVLTEIGASSTPQILVLNKVDRLKGGLEDLQSLRARLLGNPATTTDSGDSPRVTPLVGISATTGEGIPDLIETIERTLPLDPVSKVCFRVPHSDGATVNFIYDYARVLEKRDGEEYSEIVSEAPESVRRRLARFVVTESPG